MVRDALHTTLDEAAAANNTHRSTIKYNKRKLATHGSLKTRPRSGRPAKGTGFALFKIEALARANRRLKLLKLLLLVKEKGIDISLNTLRARLEDIDYRRYKARRKPFLSAESMQKRVDYAEEHLNTNWHHVSPYLTLLTAVHLHRRGQGL